jgi:hypothetical protein
MGLIWISNSMRHTEYIHQRINKWKADQVGAFEVFVDDFDNIKTIGEDVISIQDRCLTLKRSSKNTVIYLSGFNYSISLLLY